jgi:hypothetical protein
MTTLVDSKYVTRVRPNFGDEIFSKKSEVSYNTEAVHVITLGRFNNPQESMFYATAFSETNSGHEDLIASLESYRLLIDNNATVISQDVSVGQWKVKNPFPVINLLNDQRFLNENPGIAGAITTHKNTLKEQFTHESAEIIIEFWEYISELAGTKHESPNDYFLTTAYITTIRQYFETIMKQEFHGVAYPSSVTEYKAINIAITPDTVDNHLELEHVYMARFSRKHSKVNRYKFERITEISIPQNDTFSFKFI